MDPIDKAFAATPRELFVPEDLKSHAHIDSPLPIGFGQTISQPTTVQMMLQWLEAQPGDKVLDVGSGSGWTTALLSHLVGPKGKIFAVERIAELVDFGRRNAETVGVKNAKFYQAGKEFGLPRCAPYDRILVSASARELPPRLLEQLKEGGKLVIPVDTDILEIEKNPTGETETKTHSGFVFVPLLAGEEES